MKKEGKEKSIRFRLFEVLTITTIITIIIIVIINSIVLESFFTLSKINTAKRMRESVNDCYKSIFSDNINQELRNIENRNDMKMLVVANGYEIVYYADKDFVTYIMKIMYTQPQKTIYSDQNSIVNRYEEVNNQSMILISELDNGYTLYIKIPVTSIKESVNISSKVLIIIGILMSILAGFISSIVSKKFTQRIVKLNDITKKVSMLDFSEKFQESDVDDEVNTLGKNINIMSDKLETTIGQLRKNNNELEKDIEEKSKIDDMRKAFISDVSHELKTPIALIQGYAEGLLEDVNTDEESRKFYAQVIIDESSKMDKMVKELLELMKLEQEDKKLNDEEFDLKDVINEELRRQTKIIKEKNIEIDFDKNKKIKVYADPEYIEQIVNNYLTNAIKHCEEKESEKKIIIRTEKVKENKIRLFVYNTGDKIGEEIKDKIWNRFYKVDSSRNRDDGGTGIGLSIVKAIMNKYKNEYGFNNFDNGVEFYCDINLKNKKA